MSNDIQTLLNLACFKYTGCYLPVSNSDPNNWKYIDAVGWGRSYRKAIWSPHPYFNPIHLYYPSNDFAVEICRKLINYEFIHKLKITGRDVGTGNNAFGGERVQRGNFAAAPKSLAEEVEELINKKLSIYPKRGKQSVMIVINTNFPFPIWRRGEGEGGRAGRDGEPRTGRLMCVDTSIISNKIERLMEEKRKSFISANGETVLKSQDSIETLYEIKLLAIGMSCHPNSQPYVRDLHNERKHKLYLTVNTDTDVLHGFTPGGLLFYPWIENYYREQLYWRYRNQTRGELFKKYLQKANKKFKGESTHPDCLSTRDFISIYDSKSLNKKEYLEKKLIENFTCG